MSSINRPMPPETPCEADLGFEAFRYAASEMTGDEAAAFESRLAEDQDAREALARAVEVSQAVAVLGRQAVSMPGRQAVSMLGRQAATSGGRPSRRMALVSLAAAVAACIALAVALDPFGERRADRGGNDRVVQAERPSTVARLVALWADSEDLLGGDVDYSAGSAFWLDDTAGENGADSDFTWLLAAVSAELPAGEPLSPDHEQEN